MNLKQATSLTSIDCDKKEEGNYLANSKAQRPNGGRPPKRSAPGADLAHSKEAAHRRILQDCKIGLNHSHGPFMIHF